MIQKNIIIKLIKNRLFFFLHLHYMKYIFIIFLIILFFIIINKYILKNIIENFCKIPAIDPQGGINDKRVFLDYLPQSDIYTSSCDKYWKNWPLEVNNNLVTNNPIVINSDQLELPKEKQFADNSYVAGLVDFKKLADLVSEEIPVNIFDVSNELLIDPITKEQLEFKYELEYSYIELNKKSYINRWNEYNPSVKTYFKYSEIKSDIEDINILNLLFTEKCDVYQKELLTKNQLILFGLIKFQIFKYRVINIYYIQSDIKRPVYVIEISLYRESDLYLNTFSYIGFIKNKIPIITNATYIGRNSTDNVLLADFYNPKELKQQIINKNFTNTPLIEKNPDAIIKLTKEYQEKYKLKNQYACFNINYDPKKKDSYILPYYSRETCETSYDPYGKSKNVGVYDTPCKKDEDCPFFKINKNYDNNFGKCMKDGYCELPINMERIGYRYYSNKKSSDPLCYNCDSTKFEMNTLLNSCCNKQYDKTKYPDFKSPDYAFEGDSVERTNYFSKKFCTSKVGEIGSSCSKIIL